MFDTKIQLSKKLSIKYDTWVMIKMPVLHIKYN